MMSRCAIALLLSFAAGTAQAKALTLGPDYVQADGAILSYPNSRDMIDPYFPTKALMSAADHGMDVDALAEGWINWLLPRQHESGLFTRYCLDTQSQSYASCQPADADDAMMAMWIEMLYRQSKAQMPDAWLQSSAKALMQLDKLYDEASGVYFISQSMPAGLLMDNIEIYAALKRAGKEAYRIGQQQQSQDFYLRAYKLKAGIERTFWNPQAGRFIASTQAREEQGFYPDDVAQLVPTMHGFHSHSGSAEAYYTAWMKKYGDAWFALIGNQYPWGLVALAALQNKDSNTAFCWAEAVKPHRAEHRWWHVVDEAAYQVVEWKTQMSGEFLTGCRRAAS